MRGTPRPTLTRRSVLAGMLGAGGLALVNACSSSSAGGNAKGDSTTTTADPEKLYLQARFDPNGYAVTGSEQRLVVSVLNGSHDAPKNLPASVPFQLARDGKAVGAAVAAILHTDGIPVPYYPVRATIEQPGLYQLTAKLNGSDVATDLQVGAPDQSRLVRPGDALIAADTPTTRDARGVDPICTRVDNGKAAPCPLHDLNLRDALVAGKPIAFLVSTPQFCQIGICGPVLDLLLEQRAAYPGVQFIHAEVYKNPLVQSSSAAKALAPIIETYHLDFEPALFLARADGRVAQRLDLVFDRAEIKTGLDAIAA